jgi:transcriptional regulator with XRE-family HTH domain
MSTHAFGGRTHDFGIADRLRAAREDAGMDQRMFAERTGLSRATISNYERGIHKPRRPQLVVWALATGFSLHWLEHGTEPEGDGGDALASPSHRPTQGYFGVRRLLLQVAA